MYTGSPHSRSPQLPTVARAPFGVTPEGEVVEAYTITNAHGIELRVITYGGIITSLRAPDRNGESADIVLGHDSLEGYRTASPYFGAVIGRYANRIARGGFTLDGVEHRLATNDGPNHLHGGVRGFDKVVWNATSFATEDRAGIVLTYVSPDGDEGYPGTLAVRVMYTLTEENELRIKYEATTDQMTIVNLTQHTYFNLTGARRDVLDHELTIMAWHYTPVGPTLIPTGEIRPVAGTPFDFRQPVAIGARIDARDEQLVIAGGYDHNFVLEPPSDTLRLAARAYDPNSGRTLTVHTTAPGLQFYSGNFLDGSITGKAGCAYGPRYGFCLETQHFPDTPNHPNFPSAVLRPNETYRSMTVFAFGCGR